MHQVNRATLHRRSDQLEKAVRHYDVVISLEPDDPSGRQQRQAVLEQLKEGGS